MLGLAAEGLSARDAAERLFVSPATVRTHLENIRAKKILNMPDGQGAPLRE